MRTVRTVSGSAGVVVVVVRMNGSYCSSDLQLCIVYAHDLPATVCDTGNARCLWVLE